MTKKKLRKRSEKALNELKLVSRNYQGRVFCTDVKRYNDQIDMNELTSKYSKKVRDRVLEHFDEETNANLYQSWLEFEIDYFLNDYLKHNCTDDKDVKNYMRYIDVDTIGFFGRSGGWFGVKNDLYDEFEELIMDLDDDYSLDIVLGYHDVDGMFNQVKSIMWLLSEARNYNKGLSFESEMRFRIEEFIEDMKEELQVEREVATAKTLAQKHGFVLAKTI